MSSGVRVMRVGGRRSMLDLPFEFFERERRIEFLEDGGMRESF